MEEISLLISSLAYLNSLDQKVHWCVSNHPHFKGIQTFFMVLCTSAAPGLGRPFLGSQDPCGKIGVAVRRLELGEKRGLMPFTQWSCTYHFCPWFLLIPALQSTPLVFCEPSYQGNHLPGIRATSRKREECRKMAFCAQIVEYRPFLLTSENIRFWFTWDQSISLSCELEGVRRSRDGS